MCGNRFITQVCTWIQTIATETEGDVILPPLIFLASVTILAQVPPAL